MQPYEARFVNTAMIKPLNDALRFEEKTQHERSTINTLNNNGKDKNIKSDAKEIQTYDSRLGLKVFTQIMTEQTNNKVNSVS